MSVVFHLPEAFLIRYGGIDAEHQKLIDLLNECAATAVDDRIPEFETALEVFRNVLERHFEHEEAEMIEIGYPGIDRHREHHAECRRRIDALFEIARDSGHLSTGQLFECFDTIVSDIADADLKLSAYLDDRGLRNARPKLPVVG